MLLAVKMSFLWLAGCLFCIHCRLRCALCLSGHTHTQHHDCWWQKLMTEKISMANATKLPHHGFCRCQTFGNHTTNARDVWISFSSRCRLFKNKLRDWKKNCIDELANASSDIATKMLASEQNRRSVRRAKAIQMCFKWALSLLLINILSTNVT